MVQSYGLGEQNDFRDVGELSKVDLTNSKPKEMSPPGPNKLLPQGEPRPWGETEQKIGKCVFKKRLF